MLTAAYYFLKEICSGRGQRFMRLSQLFRGRQERENGKESAAAFEQAIANAQASPNLINLRQVVKVFNTPAGEFHALKGVDLQISAGEFVAVIGKSGSGKSTLSNMITGIDRPTSGMVEVAGTRVDQLSEGQIATWRGRAIGVVFQFFQLLPTLTVLENIMLPMDFSKLYTERERRSRALELLEQVEMAEQAHKLPTSLSGGQQQRVAIARALATDPPIIVADEPTGNLDSRTAEAVFDLFQRLVAGGKTILMVTHDDDLSKRVTRAVTIADGQIASDTRIAQAGAAANVAVATRPEIVRVPNPRTTDTRPTPRPSGEAIPVGYASPVMAGGGD
jgi:putative ABC transport system ATP-binding protein